MRRCNTAPSRCQQPGRPCCKDCPDKTCRARCWNDPGRCGCWEGRPPPKKRERPVKPDRAEILHLHEKGILQQEITARLGGSVSSMRKVLREMGVKAYGRS